MFNFLFFYFLVFNLFSFPVFSQQPGIDWSASWIAAGNEEPGFDTTYAAPYFRREFTLKPNIKSASAWVTGVGYFEFYLNGKKVGDQVLAPAVTRYDKTVQYLHFDVKEYLLEGEANVAGAIVGNGFYNVHTRSAWDFYKAPWRNRPAFICQLEIEYEDGEKITLQSGQSWKSTTGPITFDQLRNGEYYDARKDMPGWDQAGFDESKWFKATEVDGPTGKLTFQTMPQIKKTRSLSPVSITEPSTGVYLVDFGQNISGWAKIAVSENAGTEVVTRYGERIFEDGTLDQKELARFIFTGETQTARYIASGKGGKEKEVFEPRFTYFGFQYIQLEGLSKKPEFSELEAYMINTAFDTVGYFTCSDTLLNKIQENILWSYLGNYHSFPEDCPHREKMGWTGDAQLVAEVGMFNFDALEAYKQWLDSFIDEQRKNGDLPGIIPTSGWGYELGKDPQSRQYGYGPHWEGAAVIIPWQLYQLTGDKNILNRYYSLMDSYVQHLKNSSENYLLLFGIDDHKSIKTHTEGAYISSAYFHLLSDIMEKISDLLDKQDKRAAYKNLKTNIYNSFQKKYFNKERKSYGNGGQTALSLALGCGLVPESEKEAVLENLIQDIRAQNYHFDCGVVGLKFTINTLLEHGRTDILYRLATQTDFPSIGHWIRLGANTMWQNWDGSQSRNHIMFGSIADYFYKGLAGINIDPEIPGYENILLQPQFPEDLTYLKCGHKISSGWIHTDWKKEKGLITYHVKIPETSRCALTLPYMMNSINKDPSFQIEEKDGSSLLKLKGGEYWIKITE